MNNETELKAVKALKKLRRENGKDCLHRLADVHKLVGGDIQAVTTALETLAKAGEVYGFDGCYRLTDF